MTNLGAFYQEICALTGSHRVLPMNSGAEAVETAIKAVRKWGYESKNIPYGKAEIIVCANNFHGRTITVISFSSEETYRSGFAPLTPGFVTIPFGSANALRQAITPNTVAFLAEPIQGEGGVIVPPDGFFKQARALCDEYNILMVLDEIQTGLGRTGKLFAEEHEGIEADLTIVGKALSGGFLSRVCRAIQSGGTRSFQTGRSWAVLLVAILWPVRLPGRPSRFLSKRD